MKQCYVHVIELFLIWGWYLYFLVFSKLWKKNSNQKKIYYFGKKIERKWVFPSLQGRGGVGDLYQKDEPMPYPGDGIHIETF